MSPGKTLRASCHTSLNTAIREATATHGKKPWVVFVTSNEFGTRSVALPPDIFCRAYKLDPERILSVDCFDGDPFDYPEAKWFTDRTASAIESFLANGFWKDNSDLIVTCPTGICLSPSIVSGLGKKYGARVVLHSNKPPKYSNLIIRLITSPEARQPHFGV